MASGKLRVGIAGRRGFAFIGALRSIPQAEVTAFCDVDARARDRAAERHGIALRFQRFADMLDAVDAVVVATPMQLHVPQSVLALDAGKHVLSEVTAAVSLEECWRLLDAVKASGRTYMMAENCCYFRENVLVRELVRRGLFGEPYFGEGDYVHETRQLHHAADGSPTWRYYWQVGQRGNTYPTHSLGPVMQWFDAADPDDRPDYVVCLGTEARTDREHPHDDTCLTLVKTVKGRLIKLRLDVLSNRPLALNVYSLQGTLGAYESTRAPGEPARVWMGESRPGEERAWRPLSDYEDLLPEAWRNPPEEAIQAAHGGGDYYEVRDFVDAMLSGAPPPVDVYAALEWTAVGLCSQTSIAHGGVPIRVPNFRDPRQRPLTLDGPPIVP